MLARFAGASLGLLAFCITIVAGLYAQNPVRVTLSRSVLALFVFCVVGLVLGTAAQMVVAEYRSDREVKGRQRSDEDSDGSEEMDAGARISTSSGTTGA